MQKIACVILPTFNEADNIRVLLPDIIRQSAAISSHELHVLVVDDDSPDGTAAEVRLLMRRFPTLHLITGKKRGLGAAYQRGIEHALREFAPDLVIQMDADLQHSPSMLPLFVTLANHGFTLVIGSRFAPGGSTPDFSLRRRSLSTLGNWMIRFLGGLPRIHDCTSGYRCIAASVLRSCDLAHLSTRGYSFMSSLLCELLRNGARPIEVPITFRARVSGQSKLMLRDQLEFLGNIARIRFRTSNEFSRWAFVGGSGTAINMIAFAALRRLAGLPLAGSSLAAIELSILWNFFAEEVCRLKPRPSARWLGALARFHLVSLPAAATNLAVLLLLRRALPELPANLIGITASALVNYCSHSVWIWRQMEYAEPLEKRNPQLSGVPAVAGSAAERDRVGAG